VKTAAAAACALRRRRKPFLTAAKARAGNIKRFAFVSGVF
jgi:hypothetical protein